MDFARGKIFLDPYFRYPNSHTPCDKLLLVLNANHKPPDVLIVVPATKNRNYKDLPHGCHKQFRFFHILKQIGFYHAGTLIQLNCITYLDYDWFVNRLTRGEVTTKDEYHGSKNEIGEILSCLKEMKEGKSVV